MSPCNIISCFSVLFRKPSKRVDEKTTCNSNTFCPRLKRLFSRRKKNQFSFKTEVQGTVLSHNATQSRELSGSMEEIDLNVTSSAVSEQAKTDHSNLKRLRTVSSRLRNVMKKSQECQDTLALQQDLNRLKSVADKIEKYEEFELKEMKSSPIKISEPTPVYDPGTIQIHPGSGKPISSPIDIPNVAVEHQLNIVISAEIHNNCNEEDKTICDNTASISNDLLSVTEDIRTNEQTIPIPENELPPPIPEKQIKLPRVVCFHLKPEVQEDSMEVITVDKLFPEDQPRILLHAGQFAPNQNDPIPQCLQNIYWNFHLPNVPRRP
ncbi:uncharacterized protein LOC131434396 [Malaya genurostris]|uniref:uncharacterized protein LOC131434396 n=1 Tax=Malaya genurostris TaxID=325434 RepID=UPI0026F3A005|nr:uncharacterized protein LOC131434396 [Malaya genurostris]